MWLSFLAVLGVLACNQNQDATAIVQAVQPEMDLEAEYAKLEGTRQAFHWQLKKYVMVT